MIPFLHPGLRLGRPEVWVFLLTGSLALLATCLPACSGGPESLSRQVDHHLFSRSVLPESPQSPLPTPDVVTAGSVMKLARERSAPVLRAEHGHAASRIQVYDARSNYWPSIDLSTNLVYPLTAASESEEWDLRNFSSVMLGVRWNLFSFIANRINEQEATSRMQIARLEGVLAAKEASRKGLGLFLDYCAAFRTACDANAAAALARSELAATRQLAEEDLICLDELRREQDALDRRSARARHANQAVEHARASLLEFLDLPRHTPIVALDRRLCLPADPNRLEGVDVLSGSELVDVAELELDIARRAEAFSPYRKWLDVHTGVRYGRSLLDDGADDSPIYGVLTWTLPLLDAGDSRRAQDRAILARRAAALASDEIRKGVRQARRTTELSIQEASASYAELRGELRRAVARLRWASEGHDEGLVSALALQEAQLDRDSARTAALIAQWRLALHHVELDLLAGLDPDDWFAPVTAQPRAPIEADEGSR